MDFTIENGGLKWTDEGGKLRSLSAGNVIPKRSAHDNKIIDVIATYSGMPVYSLTDDGVFGTHTIDIDDGNGAVTQTDVQMFTDTCLANGFGK